MYLVFDTETTGLPQRWNAPIEDVDNWPRVVQLAWQLHAADGSLMEAKEFLVRPEGFNIPFGAQSMVFPRRSPKLKGIPCRRC